MKNYLNKMDCTFYFLIREKDKTVTLKEEIQETSVKHFVIGWWRLQTSKTILCVPGPVSEVR